MTAAANDPSSLALLLAASVAAGGVNAIAGGGTILTFAVLSTILPPGPGQLLAANVTSKLGLWPGAAAAAWASRHEWGRLPRWARWLVLPSTAGAVAGVVLLERLPPATFDAVVPWLILMAAVLFAVQPQVAGLVARHRHAEKGCVEPQHRHPSPPPGGEGGDRLKSPPTGMLAAACGLQFLVGIYGGYFGAGIGILMLAGLAIFSLGDIHAVNAVKNLLAAAVNGVATLLIVVAAIRGSFEVYWVHVAVAATGSIIGGVAVAKLSRRLPATAIRRLVAVVAFALAAYHLWREWA